MAATTTSRLVVLVPSASPAATRAGASRIGRSREPAASAVVHAIQVSIGMSFCGSLSWWIAIGQATTPAVASRAARAGTSRWRNVDHAARPSTTSSAGFHR